MRRRWGPIRIGGGPPEPAAQRWDRGSCGHWMWCWIGDRVGGIGRLIHQLLHWLAEYQIDGIGGIGGIH